MKYAIFGDVHGKDLGSLERALSVEDVDVLICTGDFDKVESIHQFIRLEDKYKMKGKKVVKVPGNHDHAIYTGMDLNSGELMRQGRTAIGLHRELNNNSVAKEYIKDLIAGERKGYRGFGAKGFLDEDRYSRRYKVLVMHGAPVGDLSSYPDCPAGEKALWNRLISEDDYRANFKGMKEKGFNVFIRGHDHDPVYVNMGFFGGISRYIYDGDVASFRLSDKKMHIINPGALSWGNFATINTEVPGEKFPILKYHELD